jgi:hypothetical protein
VQNFMQRPGFEWSMYWCYYRHAAWGMCRLHGLKVCMQWLTQTRATMHLMTMDAKFLHACRLKLPWSTLQLVTYTMVIASPSLWSPMLTGLAINLSNLGRLLVTYSRAHAQLVSPTHLLFSESAEYKGTENCSASQAQLHWNIMCSLMKNIKHSLSL